MRDYLEELGSREQRKRVMPSGKHRQEKTGCVCTSPGNLSMLLFTWHISPDNHLYEQSMDNPKVINQLGDRQEAYRDYLDYKPLACRPCLEAQMT